MKNYYHVKTQEAYDSLMAFLEWQGYLWGNNTKPTENNNWKTYTENTVIEVDESYKRLFYDEIKQLKDEEISNFIEWTPELAQSMCVAGMIRLIEDNK
ncbi:hypothetical protein [Enterococcus faecalis]|uniref:Uncharacterized protein n=1 Tax=Enterococcus faecalis TaxID=1351 RepID=A0AAW7K3F7_ENTFL|nr:hypothetical protein [Enterococcus faecalis]MDN3072178.1 hypothetical protein [Enterococcus faecalis]MDN3093761.1 hypothetical protein [Enterococcus faecalis]MDN3191005.1 hypothetical protein [Enterococcus faecalis]HBC7247187.1 hypothetical protein [Enterococcus faecalis]